MGTSPLRSSCVTFPVDSGCPLAHLRPPGLWGPDSGDLGLGRNHSCHPGNSKLRQGQASGRVDRWVAVGDTLWISRALTEVRLGEGRVASPDPRLWGPGTFHVARGLQLGWAFGPFLKPWAGQADALSLPGPSSLCTPGSLSTVPQRLC